MIGLELAETEPDLRFVFWAIEGQANEGTSMHLLSCCLLPSHFHLVLWPKLVGDLSKWMQFLTCELALGYLPEGGGNPAGRPTGRSSGS
jgi:hypothetical protein